MGSEDLRQRPMRPFTITDSEERGIARGLSVEEYAVGTTRSIHEGRLWVRSSLVGRNRSDNPEGDSFTGPRRTPLQGDAPSAALPVPIPPPKAVL